MAADTVTGMVISSQNIGETDRRIVLLTRERGKISAFARGAVKPKNPLVSATQLFTYGIFHVYTGRDSYTVTGAEVSKHFDFVRKSLDKYYYASYMCELARYYTRENLDAGDELLLLYRAFQALMSDALDDRLTRYIYEWRLLLINGEMPDVFRCRKCGSENPIYFSVPKQCMLCENCAPVGDGLKSGGDRPGIGGDGPKRLLPSVHHALKYIAASPLDKLFSFKVSEEAYAQLKDITDRYMAAHRQYNFNSLAFIE